MPELLPSFVHQLSTHPLKRRIAMLYKRPAAFRRTLTVCTAVSLAVAATIVGVQGCKQTPVEPQTTTTAKPPIRDTAGDIVFTKILDQAEQMPEFNGDIRTWLTENIHYPEAARKGGKHGRVVVKFYIDEKGAVREPEVVRSVDPLLDAEALRVVRSMPPWTPGQEGGGPVPVYFHLPISFQLN